MHRIFIGKELQQGRFRPDARLRHAAQGQRSGHGVRPVAALQGHAASQARYGIDEEAHLHLHKLPSCYYFFTICLSISIVPHSSFFPNRLLRPNPIGMN
ncbi:hypothetical protein SDC9_201876 [bioreactor metagenome]|uniref:Uncharacterized protein n=1 Tax=bioreactor metagenome TaxID=1076179 RepID=A0A645ISV6_9ZZZZ